MRFFFRFDFPTFNAAYFWWRHRLTVGGKAATAAMAVCIPGLIAAEVPYIQLFCVLGGLLAVAGCASLAFRPRLMVSTRGPKTAVCGETVHLTVTLSNRSWVSVFDMTPSFASVPESWTSEEPRTLNAIAVGETKTVRIAARPTHRGVFQWPKIRLTTTFPLNLLRRWRDVPVEGELIVPPAYQPLAGFHLTLSQFSSIGDLMEEGVKTGYGDEPAGNREYQPGLPVRRWDYASWARLGVPVLREFEENCDRGVALFADTFAKGFGDDREMSQTMESVLSLTAAITEALLVSAARIDTVIVGQEIIESPGAVAGETSDVILRSLAAAQLTDAKGLRELANLTLRTDSTRVSVGVFNGWDALRQACWRQLAGASVDSRLVIVAAPGQTDATYPHEALVVSPAAIAAGEAVI